MEVMIFLRLQILTITNNSINHYAKQAIIITKSGYEQMNNKKIKVKHMAICNHHKNPTTAATTNGTNSTHRKRTSCPAPDTLFNGAVR